MKSQAYKLKLDKEKLQRTFKSLKNEIGEIAVKHFKKSFDKEGFNNEPFVKWKPLKRERKRYANRKILTQTGALKNSLQYKSRLTKTEWSVVVTSTKIYAKIHNQGLMGLAWGKYPFKMPKRQFMGNSKILDKKIQTRIDNRIKTALKIKN